MMLAASLGDVHRASPPKVRNASEAVNALLALIAAKFHEDA